MYTNLYISPHVCQYVCSLGNEFWFVLWIWLRKVTVRHVKTETPISCSAGLDPPLPLQCPCHFQFRKLWDRTWIHVPLHQEHNTRTLVRVCILPRAWLVIYIDGHIRTTCAHTLEYTRTHACRIHVLSSDLFPFPHHLLFSRPTLHCIYSQNVVFPSLRLELRMCPASFLLCQGAIWKLQVCACVHTCINTCMNTRAHMQIHIFMHSFTRTKLHTQNLARRIYWNRIA